MKETTSQLVQSEKLSAIGELSAGIMHELTQPMNNIKIICQLISKDIERDPDDIIIDEIKEELIDIEKQVDKMSYVFDYMRKFSRKTDESEKEKIDLNLLINQSLKILEQQFRHKSIKLHTELSGVK